MKYIPLYTLLPEYTQAQEDTLTTQMSGQSVSLLASIFNTTMGKDRRWNGTAFENMPAIPPEILPLVTTTTTGVVPATGTPSGKYLKDDLTWATIAGGGDALTTNPLSQFASTTSLQLKGVISNETGSGALVFAESPALVTPTGIVKGDVGLGNVDNTSDANKPVSTATQTALDTKQATLVSATNIKTVNSNSLLGAGDLVVSGSANIKETEIDFGTTSLIDKSFVITDADVSLSSQILANVAYKSPSNGRNIDEISSETLQLFCAAETGQFTLFIKSLVGLVNGKFVISYLVG